MYSLNIRKAVGIFTLGAAVVIGTGVSANAQNGNWGHNRDRQDIKQKQKIAKQQAKLEQQRLRTRQARLRAEQMRQRQHQNNNVWNSGSYNANSRYRVMRGGRYYTTDGRGAELLRNAVNRGYQQGFEAGQNDRNSRRRGSYTTSNVYRSGTYGYQSYVDRGQYQHYFQQGFQKGYDDGYNSRYQYGTNQNGGVSILGSILGSILNVQSY